MLIAHNIMCGVVESVKLVEDTNKKNCTLRVK